MDEEEAQNEVDSSLESRIKRLRDELALAEKADAEARRAGIAARERIRSLKNELRGIVGLPYERDQYGNTLSGYAPTPSGIRPAFADMARVKRPA